MVVGVGWAGIQARINIELLVAELANALIKIKSVLCRAEIVALSIILAVPIVARIALDAVSCGVARKTVLRTVFAIFSNGIVKGSERALLQTNSEQAVKEGIRIATSAVAWLTSCAGLAFVGTVIALLVVCIGKEIVSTLGYTHALLDEIRWGLGTLSAPK